MVLVPFLTLFAEQYFLGRIESPSVGAVAAVFLLIFLNVWWVLRDSAERNVTVPYYLKILVASGAVHWTANLPVPVAQVRRRSAGNGYRYVHWFAFDRLCSDGCVGG